MTLLIHHITSQTPSTPVTYVVVFYRQDTVKPFVLWHCIYCTMLLYYFDVIVSSQHFLYVNETLQFSVNCEAAEYGCMLVIILMKFWVTCKVMRMCLDHGNEASYHIEHL